MKKHHDRRKAVLGANGLRPVFLVAIALLGMTTSAVAAVAIKNVPITLPNNVPGNLVLVPSVEWPTVVTQANDPGVAEGSANYAPATAYAGYFNADLCYAYNYDATEANRYFYPTVAANTNHSCTGLTGGTPLQKLWSGNYLNWVSMQALDTFRLALTGGYRVHRPADGTPPNVTITGSDLASVAKATSEMPDVTYLEKANSDRWDDGYTKLRRLTAAGTNVSAATPSSATTGFRARIAALRNQMWFVPTEGGDLGSGRAFNSPLALALPVTNGNQAEPGGAAITAIPYNPRYHALPDATTVTVTGGTVCGTDEPGCTSTTPLCSGSTTWNGSSCVGTATTVTTPAACMNASFPFFRTNDGMCHSENTNRSSRVDNSCPASTPPAVTVVLPTTNGADKTCNVTTVAVTTGTATPQYQHTSYGRNQVYAVSIRVKVCDRPLDARDICTKYGDNYKPEGLLQRNSKKIRYSLFSYLTEDGTNRQGGVMRARQKLISPVSAEEAASTETAYSDRARISGVDNPEWDPATGVFINNPDTTDATATDGLIGTACTNAPDGSQCRIQYSGVINYLNRSGQINTGLPTLKGYDNLSELYYTALRYLRGLANLSTFSSLAGTNLADYQNSDGLPVIEDWYKTGANTAVRRWNTSPTITAGTDGDPALYQCQTNVMLGIGDTSTNNEDDTDNLTKDSTASGATPIPASTWRGYTEFTNGGNGRGNLAGLAYWAHLNDLRTDVPNSNVAGGAAGAKRGQNISTYWVDVVERNDLFARNSNQFYNTTKYGGYAIPDADWNTSGNAARHDTSWFDSNRSVWSSATQNVKTVTGLGGTGDYYLPNNMYLANNGQKMIDGLNAAFAKIADNLLGSGSSLAANSTKLDTGTTTYQATYVSGEWRGNLKAFAVNPSTGVIAVTSSWDAAALLPAAADRIIKTCQDPCTGDSDKINFNTASATAAQRTALGAAAVQDGLINYLRGSAALEARNGGTLRTRTTPLGDIINSQPVFVSAPDPNLVFNKSFTGSDSYFAFAASKSTRKRRIYVAANDGMVHGFSGEAATETGQPLPGQETFAYLPNAVILANLKNLSSTTYGSTTAHQFYNDGELTVADVYLDGFNSCTGEACWRTVLVGTTGRGLAKAIYALDITDPADVKLLWERDATDSTYIGQIVGKPIIAQTANGVWSVLMGNGYNSSHNKPALLKINVQTGVLAAYETTGSSADDGLAPPAVWIRNPADNISTEAYAGDLHGNVWKFDLTSGTAGTLLYVAKNDSNVLQPITAGMIAGKNPNITSESEVWVFFGTGLSLQDFSPPTGSNPNIQTWYGLIVQGSRAVTSASTRSANLRKRTIVSQFAPDSTRPVATRAISTATADDMLGKKGWYIDLLKPTNDDSTVFTAQGERMVTPNQFQGRLLLGTSRVPADSTTFDPCDPSGTGWVMAIDPFTGVPPRTNFFDVNNDGSFNNTDNAGGGTSVTAGVGFTAIPNNPIFVSNTMLVNFDDASTGSISTRGSAGNINRLSWRELVVQ
ncbi:MAG: PilC/PilY family type IV pilus protein [Stagnimonas sp.]|nr:PilC/PilY family type IV pilus protein [Stagnimonas sp.]